ncbi:DUF4878 domain-containing protein [Hippea maritima]|uniref:Uncharacterized protein n=1 Tax=Hippea maritima (strain ATCC 700847 / DSM 10411 / MH2) TaxID=760142 RepID=F2LUM1_HIPMA|nr:DUF4878 domain-containing protein [Hippea maritima]AEA34611.1 hypothetical protein Hipma_1666 [Hippea maritima DSM 10411]
MKKILKIVGFIFILGIIAVAAALFFTSDLPETADNFFKAIKNNNYVKAQEYLSKNFRSTTPLSKLKQAFPYSRFKHYNGYSFKNREVTADGTGTLKGSIKFDDGSRIPVKISLIKENDEWKINYISISPSGLSSNTGSQSKPSLQQVSYSDLVHKTMVDLVYAIQHNDYSGFYSTTSTQFQSSVNIDKLKNAFYKFSSVNINWNDITNMKPIITKKEIQENGILKLIGYYPTQPRRLGFDFEYVKNNGKYKIIGVFLRLEK